MTIVSRVAGSAVGTGLLSNCGFLSDVRYAATSAASSSVNRKLGIFVAGQTCCGSFTQLYTQLTLTLLPRFCRLYPCFRRICVCLGLSSIGPTEWQPKHPTDSTISLPLAAF